MDNVKQLTKLSLCLHLHFFYVLLLILFKNDFFDAKGLRLKIVILFGKLYNMYINGYGVNILNEKPKCYVGFYFYIMIKYEKNVNLLQQKLKFYDILTNDYKD